MYYIVETTFSNVFNYRMLIILGIFNLQVVSFLQKWGSKPICPEEQSEGIAVESQMCHIK